MGQTKYPEWEAEVDRSIDDFIVSNFIRIEAAVEDSNGSYREIWHEIRDQLFERYSLNGNGNQTVQEKRAYIQSRIGFFRDREFPYLQGDAEREFILTWHKMPEGPEWDKFVKQCADANPRDEENYAHLFG